MHGETVGTGLWHVAALVSFSISAACSSSAPEIPNGMCSELYGQGLTGCTEHCRPFAVADFGVIVGADGSVVWTCECMPAPTYDSEDPVRGDTGSDREARESVAPSTGSVEVAVTHRGHQTSATSRRTPLRSAG